MKKKIIILSLALFLLIFTGITSAQGNEHIQVKVTIPKFNIKINGFSIDNQHNKYPMIVYKDVTYLPLTDGYCKALGLTTAWDNIRGYIINDNNNYDAPDQNLSGNNDLNIKYDASIPNFKIIINGEEVINNEEEFPILFFRDTVYLPLTKELEEKFSWKLYWDNEDGLNIIGDGLKALDINIIGDWIYYLQNYSIYKMKVDGSEKTKFADAGLACEIMIKDDWIYYINFSDGNRLYKIKTDGTNKTRLSDRRVFEILGIEDSIYYISQENYNYINSNYLYKMRLDGSKKVKFENLEEENMFSPIIKDGWIYYSNDEDSGRIYKIRENGQDKTKLTDIPVYKLQIVGEWIYYVSQLDENLYRVKLDGSNNSKVLDEKVHYFTTKDDWVYYGNGDDRYKLYKIKLDGTGKTKLNNEFSNVIDVVNGWVYYDAVYNNHSLKIVRTNINTGLTENLLPNGPEKFYYINGIRIQGQYGGRSLSHNNFYYDGRDKTTEELAQLSKSIVLINGFNEKGEIISQGSGVVISEDGLIVTNGHVLYDSAYVGVTFEGIKERKYFFTLNIINIDSEKDLALIKLPIKGTQPIKLGDSDNFNKGEKVVAIGNPFGLENTISDGIIAGKRNIGEIEIIQTTTPISPGSSGGALLNMKGELLGLTFMTNREGQNLNFAIPSKYIKELLEEKVTKMNLEILQKNYLFTYNDSSIIFDSYNYFNDDKYIVNFIANTQILMDFNVFANSNEFKKQIQEFYMENLEEIVRKYDIKEYEFNLFAGRYVFSYQYDKGKIKKIEWKENKTLTKNKTNKEKILRINLANKYASLDPQFNRNITGFHIINNMFEGLMREEDGRLEYGIAKKYTVSEDGRTYTFYLRDAKWSDGQPVKASDFEYSWKRALDPYLASDYAYQLFYIEGAKEYYRGTGKVEDISIKAIDDHTLRVTLNKPVPYFPKLTTLPIYMPVRKDVVEKNPKGWFRDPSTLISNGPFKLEEYKEGFKLTLVKNKEYYDFKSVSLDKIELYMINDQSISTAAYKAGEFDIIDFVPDEEYKDVYNKKELKRIPVTGVTYCIFNLEKAPVNDVKVRKALALAIDRETIINKIASNDRFIPAYDIVPYGIYTSEGKEFRDLAKSNGILDEKERISEAKKLLKEAGYPGGKGLPELTILYNETPGNKEIAQTIKEMWEKNLDVKVKLESEEWVIHIDRLSKGKFMIGRSGWLADYNDPVNFLELFTSYSIAGYDIGWNSDEYDQLIQTSYITSDKERDKVLLDAERILIDEMIVIPLYYFTDTILAKDNVKNLQRTSLGYWYFRNTEIK